MSTELLIRSFFIFIICGVVAYCSYFREDKESSLEEPKGKGPRYSNYIPMYVLPEFVLIILIGCTAYYGWEYSSELLLSWCLGTFTHISIFYLILMLFLPLLRRYISARACAELWMLPTLLYMAEHSFMSLPEPLLVITLPNGFIGKALVIWLVGFIVVLLGYIIHHLIFRHCILKDAVPVNDAEILDVWLAERNHGNFSRNFKVVLSTATKTPLSIGLFKRTTKVVLPAREYTSEELHLIFRHELVHIGREDSGTKFFMVFCTAFCWFNPLMWLAMRKSADDLELSCDETVLLDADENTRTKYADLILKTAGENYGFTTSLSASATALRYRLSNIMKQRKRFNGGLVVGIVLFAFMMTSGYIAFAYESSTGDDFIFYSGTPEEHVLRSVRFWNGQESDYYDCIDEDSFKEYLAGLEFRHISGNYTFPEGEHEMTCIFMGNDGAFGITLTDTAVKITPLYGENLRSEYYYLASEVDWEYVSSLLAEQINYYEDTLPDHPELKIWWEESENGETIPGVVFTTIIDGKVTESIDPNEIPQSIVFTDVKSDKMKIEFSHSVYSDYTIEIYNWDRSELEFVDLDDYVADDSFKLAPYDAHYNVYASFQMEGGKVIDVVFKFDVELAK